MSRRRHHLVLLTLTVAFAQTVCAAEPRPGDEFAGGKVHTATTRVDGAEYRVEIQFFKAPHWGQCWKSVGRDKAGRIYMGNSSQEENSFLYRLDPKTGKCRYLGDLLGNLRFGRPGGPDNGKIHSTFVEGPDGGMYFVSHEGWGRPTRYGGHLWKLDPKTDRVADLGAPLPGNTNLVLSDVDPARNCIYTVSMPASYLVRYDLRTGTFTALCPTVTNGVRFLLMDPAGDLYWFGESEIHRYSPATGRTEVVMQHPEESTGEKGFAGIGAFCWSADRKRIYFVSYKKAVLFAWDIGSPKVEVLGRLHPTGRDLQCSNLHLDAAGRRLYSLGAENVKFDKGLYCFDLARRKGYKLLDTESIIDQEIGKSHPGRPTWADFQDYGGVTGNDGTMYSGFWGGDVDKDVSEEGDSFAALVATRVKVKE